MLSPFSNENKSCCSRLPHPKNHVLLVLPAPCARIARTMLSTFFGGPIFKWLELPHTRITILLAYVPIREQKLNPLRGASLRSAPRSSHQGAQETYQKTCPETVPELFQRTPNRDPTDALEVDILSLACLAWLACPCVPGVLSLSVAAFAWPLSIETAKMSRSLDPCRSKWLRVSARSTPVDPCH